MWERVVEWVVMIRGSDWYGWVMYGLLVVESFWFGWMARYVVNFHRDTENKYSEIVDIWGNKEGRKFLRKRQKVYRQWQIFKRETFDDLV